MPGLQAWVDVGVDLGFRVVSVHDEGLLGVGAVEAQAMINV